ncbi:MAG: hypothetical protein U0T75_00370 [Chitinophagales bacterium]
MAMPGDYSLYVETGIMTERVKVAVKTTADWSDCVFDDNYNLLTFKELEDYIKENHHLPEVPRAEDVVKSGLDLGRMNAIFLQKVEELTLYLLELKRGQ